MNIYQKGRSSARLVLRGERAFLFLPFKHSGHEEHKGLMASRTKKVFQPVPAETERVGKAVLDTAYAVPYELGPGLLESVYLVAMKHVIATIGMPVETEIKLPILFRRVKLESGFAWICS